MRFLATMIIVAGAALATTPAPAQTYASFGAPACMQVYGELNYFDCSYSSIGQCQASATGRAAQCIANPYYASARAPEPASDQRRHRRY